MKSASEKSSSSEQMELGDESMSGKESVQIYADASESKFKSPRGKPSGSEIAQSSCSSNNSEPMELGDESKLSMIPRKSSLDTYSNRNRMSTTPIGINDSGETFSVIFKHCDVSTLKN